MTCRRHPFRAGSHRCLGAVPRPRAPGESPEGRSARGVWPRPRPLHPQSGRRKGGDAAAVKEGSVRGFEARRRLGLGRQNPEYAAAGAQGPEPTDRSGSARPHFQRGQLGATESSGCPSTGIVSLARGRQKAWNPGPPFGWLGALGQVIDLSGSRAWVKGGRPPSDGVRLL